MVHKERCLKCQKDFEVKYLSSIPDFILLVQKSNLKLPCFIYIYFNVCFSVSLIEKKADWYYKNFTKSIRNKL